MTRLSRSMLTIIPILGIGVVIAFGAYRIIGWLGVGLFGLLATFVAVQAEMDDAAPIGGTQNTDLYAMTLQGQDRQSRAEKAARRADAVASSKILTIVKLIGGGFALIGLIGFVGVQLPH